MMKYISITRQNTSKLLTCFIRFEQLAWGINGWELVDVTIVVAGSAP